MSLSKIKTDKSDAKQIYRYALKVDLTLWYGESEMQQDSLQIVRLLSNYTKQSTMMKNKLHGEDVFRNTFKDNSSILKKTVKELTKRD